MQSFYVNQMKQVPICFSVNQQNVFQTSLQLTDIDAYCLSPLYSGDIG